MKKTLTKLFVTLLVFGAAISINAQYKAGNLRLKSSTIIEQLIALKNQTPKLTTDEIVKEANRLLDQSGINFMVSLDPATCQTLRKTKAARKDQSAPFDVSGTLRSVGADSVTLALPEPQFTDAACGDCFLEVRLLQITGEDFVTIISGRNIKFHLPKKVYTNEVRLVEPNDPKVTRKKWKIPFRSTPIGVSYDENVLYLAFNEPELADLSLFVFGEGVFMIGTRAEAEVGGKGKPEPAPANADYKMMRFDRWQRSYVVAYKPQCAN